MITEIESAQPGTGATGLVLISSIRTSPSNPRRVKDDAKLEQLVESVKAHGVLQPVLVRDMGSYYELVAGHRRLEAARRAGLQHLHVMIRDLDDREVLEIQVIENLERSDLHPLEEAAGYQALVQQHKYEVARIAERIGRSVPYVYDRLKLIKLCAEAKKLFHEDRITAGHAIILARLKPEDQKRAIDPDTGGLFQEERLLWDPDDDDPHGPAEFMKTRSVKELQAWVDEHVRFNAREPDPVLFPETAAEIDRAKKVIPITHNHYIKPEARDGRTFGPRSWKRADGEKRSKTCDYSVTGFIAVGPGRGQAFAVCTAKDRCRIHWGPEMREKAKRAAAREAAPSSAQKSAPANAAEEKARLEAGARAHAMAQSEFGDLLLTTAEQQPSEDFVRRVACCLGPDGVTAYLSENKIKAKPNEWVWSSSRREIQRAVVWLLLDMWDADADMIGEAFGIDWQAIFEKHEKAALAKLKAETKAKATAKRPARHGKKK